MTPEAINRLARKRAGAKLGCGLGLTLHGIAVWFLGAGAGFRERLVPKERESLQRQQDRH